MEDMVIFKNNKFDRSYSTRILLRFMLTARKMRIHEWELLEHQIEWNVRPMEWYDTRRI